MGPCAARVACGWGAEGVLAVWGCLPELAISDGSPGWAPAEGSAATGGPLCIGRSLYQADFVAANLHL